MTTTIGDLVPIVVSLLGNRTDLATKASQWIAWGYRDLGSTIPFETLEFTQNQQTVQNIDTYGYPPTARAIKSLSIVINSAPRQLWKRNVQVIDQYQTRNPGIPAVWAPFNKNFIVRPVPNGPYDMIVRYWQTPQMASVIDDTKILLPDDWIEIVSYEAQMRGYIDLTEPDKAAGVRQLLYGNPMKPGYPGLIKQRLTRIQAENANANYPMRPRTTRYGNVI